MNDRHFFFCVSSLSMITRKTASDDSRGASGAGRLVRRLKLLTRRTCARARTPGERP